LYSSTVDQYNVCVGWSSLESLNGGQFNTCLGTSTGTSLSTGNYNTLLGMNAGGNYSASESSNILINNIGTGGESNTLRIGSATGTGSQMINQAFICGIQGIAVTGAAVLVSGSDQLGVTVSSRRFKDNIEDMGDYSSSILDLRPVTFTMKGDQQIVPGLIAEEVAEVMPDLVVYDLQGDPQTVKYHELPAMLLNELQKAIARIEVLEAKLQGS